MDKMIFGGKTGGKTSIFIYKMFISLLPDSMILGNICKATNLPHFLSTSRLRINQFYQRLVKLNQDSSSPQWWVFILFGGKLVAKFFCLLT